jgi:hypothetical protein
MLAVVEQVNGVAVNLWPFLGLRGTGAKKHAAQYELIWTGGTMTIR